MRRRMWAMAVMAGATALVAACSTSASPSSAGAHRPSASASATQQANGAAATVLIKTRRTKVGTVLTSAAGRTLYWFAKDTPTKSNCNGSCASYWPPVIGKPAAAAGTSLPHGFGTITRSGGKVQATYDGHPLYTYKGDTAAGQVNGNDVSLSGGLWWAMTPSGSKASASSSGSSGSGGY